MAGAIDPNEKIGPGTGPQGWVTADALLPYRINFENLGPGSKDPNGDPYPNPATAPAQRVIVTDQLQPELDWDTFHLTELGFGDVIVPVPSGASHFTGRVPMTYNNQTFEVQIEAGIDFSTGMVSIRFQSINPETSLPPDVLTGFLPPEDGTGRGMGHVSFTVRSRQDLPTGTEIRNVADIKFDINEVITTDQVDPQDASQGADPDKQALVTLDADPPTSTVNVLAAATQDPEFLVSWSGTDPGAGIASYDIYFSENGGGWTLWQSGVTNTSALFQGRHQHSYRFISVARDHVGNIEQTPTEAQAETTVTGEPGPVLRISKTLSAPGGETIEVTLSYDVVPGYTYTLYAAERLDALEDWEALPEAPHQSGTFTDITTEPRRFYRLTRELSE